MDKLYVSSGAFKSNDIHEIIKKFKNTGLRNFEMTAGLNYQDDLIDILLKQKDDMNLLVHNYFPPPEVSFVLNLGSNNETIKNKSLDLCKQAIMLTAKLGGEFYAVHCGFAFDADGRHLGNKSQMELPRIPLNEALTNFVNNLRELVEFAAIQNVKLAIENNVLAEFGLIDGENHLCLGTDSKGLKEIFDLVNHENLYLLLDLGHAKVNENTLNAPIQEIIDELGDYIIGIHVSDNDGYYDTNSKLTEVSTVLQFLKPFKDKYIVLEVYNLEKEEIFQQIDLIKSFLAEEVNRN